MKLKHRKDDNKLAQTEALKESERKKTAPLLFLRFLCSEDKEFVLFSSSF
jgi:hypothetical protein